MTSAPTRVLYIAGSGRSGTNFLGHILGQVEGFAFIGEAMYGGESLATRRCGCGAALADCPFWLAVRDAVGGNHRLTAPDFFGLGRLARWRHLPTSLRPGGGSRLVAQYGEHWDRCQRLYAAAAALSGAEVTRGPLAFVVPPDLTYTDRGTFGAPAGSCQRTSILLHAVQLRKRASDRERWLLSRAEAVM